MLKQHRTREGRRDNGRMVDAYRMFHGVVKDTARAAKEAVCGSSCRSYTPQTVEGYNPFGRNIGYFRRIATQQRS
ncbi:MAG: hypothetical protein JSW08_01855 [archaeon]|nr:MAG: hypothetical protein JSW08_01855 [archaeon]